MLLIVAEMRAHETLPELSMVRNEEVQQLVHDDMILKLIGERHERFIEGQAARGRVGRPFGRHGAQ